MKQLSIVKVGGAVVEQPDKLARLITDFASIPGRKILVHGGGRSATRIAASLGIESQMIDGRRVTDEAMLRVVTMVYGGLVNKNIVASLQAAGINAVGLTGADMDIIRSHRRTVTTVDYGYVGDVDRVNADALASLLESGIVPVVAPLSHDGQGSMLNTNADTIASEVARAMARKYETTLTFCFELPGVMRDASDSSSVIPEINPVTYRELRENGVVAGGMIPKLDNAFRALTDGVAAVVITSADSLADPTSGTRIHL